MPAGGKRTGEHNELIRRLQQWRSGDGSRAPVIQLVGAGTREWFESGMRDAGADVVVCDLVAVEIDDSMSLSNGCVAAARVARVHDAVLLVVGRDARSGAQRTWFDETGVGLAPGSAFGPGGEGYLRLCFASSSERLVAAMHRLRPALS